MGEIKGLHDQLLWVVWIWLSLAARLQVLHGVVVVLQEDDGVRRGQVEAQAAHVRREQHHVDGGV